MDRAVTASAGTMAPKSLSPMHLFRASQVIAHWAEFTPDAPAISDPCRGLSYRELEHAIDRAAQLLLERNVRTGDRVTIVAENNVAAAVYMFATQRVNAWPAIINARLGHREIQGLQECVGSRLTIFAVDGAPAASGAAASAGIDDAIEDASSGRVLLSNVNPMCEPELAPALGEHQVGLLIFTSGTTGKPKAVMLSHHALIHLGAVLSKSRRTSSKDSYNGVAPLSHIMGIANLMNATWSGAGLRLMPRLELPVLARSIASGEISHLSFVPTVYSRLVEYVETSHYDMSGHRLRYISCGGAPLDPLLKQRVEALFKLRLVNGYGMTECAPAVRSRPDFDSPAQSIGWPEEGVETRIVTPDGTTCEPNDVGELWLRSSTQMMGYYRNPEETTAALRPGGWLATGDLAQLMSDGQIALVGRRKEMIIRSGFNVYPAEVEAALNRLPQVLQSAVVGRKTRDGNEEVIAFIQPRCAAAISTAQILAGLGDNLAPYKRPQRIVLLDSLPLVATGKIWKSKLAEMAAELPAAELRPNQQASRQTTSTP